MTKKPKTVQDFSKDIPQTYRDGRLNAPAFHRNHEPIRACLKQELTASSGHALEIGSGTGQHIIHFAADHPNLTWWPTDIAQSHLKSIEAWRKTSGAENIKSPIALDASQEDWQFGEVGRPPGDALSLIISLNVIHISPWAVAEGLFQGADRYLRGDGKLILYGPFSFNGEHTSESNKKFDATLKDRNPDWGVRDVTDLNNLAAPVGLKPARAISMPANNFVLVFER